MGSQKGLEEAYVAGWYAEVSLRIASHSMIRFLPG